MSFGSDTGQGRRARTDEATAHALGYCGDDFIPPSVLSGNASRMAIAPPALNPQVVSPKMVSGFDRQGNPVDVLCGTEFLKTITSKEVGNTQGAILFSVPINPANFPLTRIAQFAPLYQRYRFRKLNFIYGAIANETISGQVIGFGDYDVDNMLTTDSAANMNQAAAHVGERVNQISEHAKYPFGIRDSYTSLYTSLTEAEARLIYQGVFYLLAASAIDNNIQLGNIYIEYEVEFSINQLQVDAVEKVVLSSYGDCSEPTPPTLTTTMVPPSFAQATSDGYANNIPMSHSVSGVSYTLPEGEYTFSNSATIATSSSGAGDFVMDPQASAIGGTVNLPISDATTWTALSVGDVTTYVYSATLKVTPTVPGDTVLVTVNPKITLSGGAAVIGTSPYAYTQRLSGLKTSAPLSSLAVPSTRAPKLVTQNKRMKLDERRMDIMNAELLKQRKVVEDLLAAYQAKYNAPARDKGKGKVKRTILVPLSDSDDDHPV